MSWLNKLGFGLQKSSNKISSGIKSIFTTQKLASSTIEELEELLISADMGVKTSSKLAQTIAQNRFDKNITENEIKQVLAKEIEQIISPCQQEFSLNNNPEVILMVGVNGAGKTTTIGKLASRYKNKKTAFIAADTFRAAAVEQLEAWGNRNNIPVYKGAPNCDAAGLCFDALTQTLSKKEELIFIDTAGRLQNKKGLMDELQKIVRVIKKVIPSAPHKILLTIDASTGQNALEQIKIFKELVDVNGLIITKLDGSAKGGILVAAADEFSLPVYFIGVGEKIEDLQPFQAQDYAQKLLGI